MPGSGTYLGCLVGELEHQPLVGDEAGRGGAGVLGLEEASGIPEQGVAEFGRAAQFVAVAAGGGLDERGVQDGEALQVAARTVAFDDVDVCAGPGIEPAGQVLARAAGRAASPAP
ncbi:hypothetical protein [Streptomyces bobili]|uniref:hypothetical protein n=1 Tax=Streptomyces bobili TaxID=67280 RepID=UPI0037F40D3A